MNPYTPAEQYMRRCFELARLGWGRVSPNPAVGAVLVHQDRIIGEGYHAYYGGAHAEVNALAAVRPADRSLISQSTLYVSLEPCCIHGRTPPCTDLILRSGIPRVVVAVQDATPEVAGQGLELLRAAGVDVTEGVLAAEGHLLSWPRQVYVSQQRPLVLLKYARSANGWLAPAATPYWITHPVSRRLVHRWRTQTAAILIGGRTARADDPALTARYFPGPQPLRVVWSASGDLPAHLQLLTDGLPTLVYSYQHSYHSSDGVEWVTIPTEQDWLTYLLRDLHHRAINHLTVEGGEYLLRQFIERELWEEAAVFTGLETIFTTGSARAPDLPVGAIAEERIIDDRLAFYRRRAGLKG